jgi:hypothetical protein
MQWQHCLYANSHMTTLTTTTNVNNSCREKVNVYPIKRSHVRFCCYDGESRMPELGLTVVPVIIRQNVATDYRCTRTNELRPMSVECNVARAGFTVVGARGNQNVEAPVSRAGFTVVGAPGQSKCGGPCQQGRIYSCGGPGQSKYGGPCQQGLIYSCGGPGVIKMWRPLSAGPDLQLRRHLSAGTDLKRYAISISLLQASYRSRDRFPAMITWTIFAVKKKLGFYGGPCFADAPPPLNRAMSVASLQSEWN